MPREEFPLNPFLRLQGKTVEFALNILMDGVPHYAKGNGVMHTVDGSITIQVDRFDYPNGFALEIKLSIETAQKILPHPEKTFDYQVVEV